MDKINNVIVNLGHKQFIKKQTKELKVKGDSFVMKTKVRSHRCHHKKHLFCLLYIPIMYHPSINFLIFGKTRKYS